MLKLLIAIANTNHEDDTCLLKKKIKELINEGNERRALAATAAN